MRFFCEYDQPCPPHPQSPSHLAWYLYWIIDSPQPCTLYDGLRSWGIGSESTCIPIEWVIKFHMILGSTSYFISMLYSRDLWTFHTSITKLSWNAFLRPFNKSSINIPVIERVLALYNIIPNILLRRPSIVFESFCFKTLKLT